MCAMLTQVVQAKELWQLEATLQVVYTDAATHKDVGWLGEESKG